MPIKFVPHYTITPAIARDLMRIEAIKEKIIYLPLTPQILSSLRETARLHSTHYSTMIEGNALSVHQVKEVVQYAEHFPGRERDEREVKGYYAALTQVEEWVAQGIHVTQKIIQILHARVMEGSSLKSKPTEYRDGQNVIRDGRTGAIVYLPPEAKDVPELMDAMIRWINQNNQLPCPLVAGIAHYQCATIHPYYDGNGRTARLLTTLILHLGGYDLKGLYSLEEYYARNLTAYYRAISIGPSHNYYEGRAEADITPWIEYFIEGMAVAFENVVAHMTEAEQKGAKDQSPLLRTLDPRQRKVLDLFKEHETITSTDVGKLFGFKQRTSSELCRIWAERGFFEIVDFSRKGRRYKLSHIYEQLLT